MENKKNDIQKVMFHVSMENQEKVLQFVQLSEVKLLLLMVCIKKKLLDLVNILHQ